MTRYPLTPQVFNDLTHRFTYHPPTGPDQLSRFVCLREKAKELALDIASLVPDGRERNVALTNLEQAVFWANAGIARGEGKSPQVQVPAIFGGTAYDNEPKGESD